MSVGIHNLPEQVRANTFGSYLAAGDSLTVGQYATGHYGFAYLVKDQLVALGHASTFHVASVIGDGIDNTIAHPAHRAGDLSLRSHLRRGGHQ